MNTGRVLTLRHVTRCRLSGVTSQSRNNHTSTKTLPATEYVIQSVKKHDQESYLLLMLTPKQRRYPLFVVHALNVEVSLALESVTDSRTAAGRFTFWEDAIERIYNSQTSYDHPVLNELARVHAAGLISSHHSKNSLLNLIRARRAISNVTHLNTVEQLETYSEHTKSSLHYLTMGITGCSDVNTDHAASHLGKCTGIINAIRSTPYLISKNQLLIPQQILSKHAVSQNDVVRGRDNVSEPVFDLASTAKLHLDHTKQLLDKIPNTAKPYFLSTALCDYHLEHLRKCDFNIFSSSFLRKDGLLAWRLWWASFKYR